MTTVEETLRGGFGKRGAQSGADGRFRLDGLLEERYTLQAFDPQTTALGEGWEVDAGERGLELVLVSEPGTVPVSGRVVSLSGEPIANLGVRPRRSGRQPVLCEMQVDLGADPDRADRLHILDRDGGRLRIVEFHGAFVSHGDVAVVRNGLSGVLRVDERARTLVLLKDEEEVERVTIELHLDERETIRL